ncbi:fumarylacetoacetate hydrolase family protein [Halobacterium bonnevillei]|uniref:Fumarylacetoacetase n=1 Tax=Halobacterium bonnevillei TaxID=2692200 RepID=A0A6B0SID9_9EURY|nr:fumarylacetoacetate hydrolase family protein [Halobacterium bonnevillei]MXR20857.1 fumarylacetoacetase [Halobacterium bonnevillei]
MRLARLRTDQGVVEGEYRDGAVVTDDAEYVVGEDGTLAPPCDPSAVYCVGRNYAATIDQMDYERPDQPDFFIKPPVSVVGHETPVPYPSFTDELTYAGELAAVVDERCHRVPEADVPDVLRGFTVLNDLDALDQPGRSARKAFDGSGPLGPWVETDVDPRGIDVHTDVAGERRQEANTDLMLFDPYEVVAFLSERFTFQPGDVVAFGSPANPGLVEPGDTVEITYEGVGTLRNTIVESELE